MISIVIVNYYSESFLQRLIPQLLQTSLVSKIIIVNNGSASELTFETKKITIINNKKNEGFAKAVNLGYQQTKTDWVLLLNPDILINQDTISELYKAALVHQSAISGPRFFMDEEKKYKMPPATGSSLLSELTHNIINYSQFDASLYSYDWEIRHQHFWQQNSAFYEPFLSGACLLINKLWLNIDSGKLLDELFFLYYEDTDLCVQQLFKGVRSLCVPESEVVHYYNQSPDPGQSKLQLMRQAHAQFFRKYYPLLSLPAYVPPNFKEKLNIINLKYHDLGSISTIPCFELDVNERVPIYFEISSSCFFVPFIQTDYDINGFKLSQNIWQTLRSGQYYARLRTISGKIIKIWRWNKRGE